MVYMVTFTINISPILAYIPYMDPIGLQPYLPSSNQAWQLDIREP